MGVQISYQLPNLPLLLKIEMHAFSTALETRWHLGTQTQTWRFSAEHAATPVSRITQTTLANAQIPALSEERVEVMHQIHPSLVLPRWWLQSRWSLMPWNPEPFSSHRRMIIQQTSVIPSSEMQLFVQPIHLCLPILPDIWWQFPRRR